MSRSYLPPCPRSYSYSIDHAPALTSSLMLCFSQLVITWYHIWNSILISFPRLIVNTHERHALCSTIPIQDPKETTDGGCHSRVSLVLPRIVSSSDLYHFRQHSGLARPDFPTFAGRMASTSPSQLILIPPLRIPPRCVPFAP